jgi:hypothetical protein
MNNNEKVIYKDNRRNFCNCWACLDSEFRYQNDLLLKDSDSRIFQFLGKENLK